MKLTYKIFAGILQIKAGKDMAATSAHLWLEKNAFYKVPRALQDETVELNRRPFEDVSSLQPSQRGKYP